MTKNAENGIFWHQLFSTFKKFVTVSFGNKTISSKTVLYNETPPFIIPGKLLNLKTQLYKPLIKLNFQNYEAMLAQ